jgi:hypothetical protein
MPSSMTPRPLSSEPRTNTTLLTSPNSSRAKFSRGPKVSATADKGAASKATTAVPTVPATKEPSAATASATPARPWRAMAWPSTAVITDEASPGTLSRMDVVEPPYWAP